MPRPRSTRKDYVVFHEMTTRWRDNDVYGHLNNVVFQEYVDSCVNAWLMGPGGLRIPDGPIIGLVVEAACIYHASISYPERIITGLRASRIGNSSVTFEVGLFREDDDDAAAEARFTHVYVDSATRRPVPLPNGLRQALEKLKRSDQVQ